MQPCCLVQYATDVYIKRSNYCPISGLIIAHLTYIYIALLKALDGLLADPGFRIPSPLTAAALKTASELKKWCELPEHQAKVEEFTSKLERDLVTCFKHSTNAAQRSRREKMWGSFHRLRTSKISKRTGKTSFKRQSVPPHALPSSSMLLPLFSWSWYAANFQSLRMTPQTKKYERYRMKSGMHYDMPLAMYQDI